MKKINEFPDNMLALSDLKNGRVEAVVIDEVVMKYFMSKEEGIYKILEESLAPEQYGIGVKKATRSASKPAKALDEMNADGTATKISEKWFGENKVLK